MADKFQGKFVLESMENMEKYMESFGQPGAFKMLEKEKLTVEVKVNGEELELTEHYGEQTGHITVKIGQEFTYNTPLYTEPLKIVCNISEDGKMVETHKCAGKTGNVVTEMGEDGYHITMECGGVVGKLVMKKV